MRLWDGTEIVKPVVDEGISQWAVMAEDLDRAASKLSAKVEEAISAAPWGSGAEGEAFRAAHFRGDGPNQMLLRLAQISEDIADAGNRVRVSVGNTLRTDADIKHDLQAGLVREI